MAVHMAVHMILHKIVHRTVCSSVGLHRTTVHGNLRSTVLVHRTVRMAVSYRIVHRAVQAFLLFKFILMYTL